MQLKKRAVFRSRNGIDEQEYSKQVYQRKDKIEKFESLRREGCSIKTALFAIDVKQSTLYDWRKSYKKYGLEGLEPQSRRPNRLRQSKQSNETKKKILKIRRQNPLWGRAKVRRILEREYAIKRSESTVGRVLRMYMNLGKVRPVAHYLYAKGRKNPRMFNVHAKRLPEGLTSSCVGDLVQIDHMTVTLYNGRKIKHFQAVCPTSRYAVKMVSRKADSATAATFLEKVQREMPFPLISLQVDGGSEFRGDFELLCKAIDLPLYVIPPRDPETNGSVERCNGTSKYEFYTLYSGSTLLEHLQAALQKFVHKYNTWRPHQALQYLTPQEYLLQYRGH